MEEKEREDAEHLRGLRETAGLNIAQLAAMANLSAGQMRQLEEGGDNLFYSPQIKAQSMRRVIRLLEHPAPSADNTGQLTTEEPALRSPANVIDDIIRLSEKNLSGNVVTSAVRRPSRMGGMLSLVLLATVGLVTLAAWQSKQDIPISKLTEWVNPNGTTVQADAKASPNLTEAVVSVPVKTEEVKVDIAANAAASAPTVNSPAPSNGQLNTPPTAETKPVVETVKTTAETKPAAESTKPFEPAKPDNMVAAAKDKKECAGANTDATSVSPHAVTKPGNYVYLQATKPVQLCIDDAQRNRTVLNLEPGAGRSVHGSPPWIISSNSLSSVNIYYQGSKLMLPANVGQRIFLAEQVVNP